MKKKPALVRRLDAVKKKIAAQGKRLQRMGRDLHRLVLRERAHERKDVRRFRAVRHARTR